MQQLGSNPDILLLSDGSLDRAVRLAVAGLSGAAVHIVRSLPAAMVQMASQTVGLILVQAGRCPDQLRQLAAMSHRDQRRPNRMVIIGGNGGDAGDHEPPPFATLLPQTDTESLSRLLATYEAAAAPRARMLPEDDIQGGWRASRLHARYQPIVAVADRTLLAFEALARLQHPALGLLHPTHFMPQIEQAGLGWQLTEAMLDLVLEDAREHLQTDAPLADAALSINLPLDVLMHTGTAAWLQARCAKARVAAGRIIIEITESQPVALLTRAGRSALGRAIEQLRAMGYRVAIDDFGPEMPQRQDLLSLPIDLLKLDKGVIRHPDREALITQAVRAAARGFRVIAEGVETAADWQRVAELGVDYVQGFLVSRPLPPSHVAEWHESWVPRPG